MTLTVLRAHRMGFWLGLVVVLQMSCLGAPDRENPFDPKSEQFRNVGLISGTTSALLAPSPLAGVIIRLHPGLLSTQSDARGSFLLDNVPAGKYQVVATLDGYAPATDSVQVVLGKLATLDMKLDALPVIDSVSVSSLHIARAFPAADFWFLDGRTTATDPDGVSDLAVMELRIPWLDYLDTLVVTSTPGVFEKVVDQAELPGASLESLIGRRIFIRAEDRAGFSTISQPVNLARVISITPEALSPISFELIDNPNPVLTWKPVALPFAYSFRVDVIRSEFSFEANVWTRQNIGSAETSIQVGLPLSSGNYLWAISVVDEFGNRSRSLEARFQIK